MTDTPDIVEQLRAPIDQPSPQLLIWELLSQRSKAADEIDNWKKMAANEGAIRLKLEIEIERLRADKAAAEIEITALRTKLDATAESIKDLTIKILEDIKQRALAGKL